MAEETRPSHESKPAPKNAEAKAEGAPAKGGNWIEKHKVVAYGAMGIILVVLFIFLRRGSSSSSDTSSSPSQTASQNGIDPATGYLYGSAADISALNGGSGTSASTPSGGTVNNYYSGTGTPGTGSTGTTTTGASSPFAAGQTITSTGGTYTVGSNGLINSGSVDESYTQGKSKQTLSQVAKNLGVSVSSLIGSNASGKAAAKNPNATVAPGSKFTYTNTVRL